ncbi:13573_t:CDS:1, partial [Dentiscutata heterogama]
MHRLLFYGKFTIRLFAKHSNYISMLGRYCIILKNKKQCRVYDHSSIFK